MDKSKILLSRHDQPYSCKNCAYKDCDITTTSITHSCSHLDMPTYSKIMINKVFEHRCNNWKEIHHMNKYQKISNIFNFSGISRSLNGLISQAAQLKNIMFYGTEKVDGTNIRIYWNGYSIRIAGRVNDTADDIPVKLREYLASIFLTKEMEYVFEEKFGSKEVYLFGEGYGPGVNDTGNLYTETPKIIMFGAIINGFDLSVDNCRILFSELGLESVPLLGKHNLNYWIKYVAQHHSSKLGNGSHEMEGVVVTAAPDLFDRNRNRIRFKIRYDDVSKINKVTTTGDPLLDYAIRRMEREDQDKSSNNLCKDFSDKLLSCQADLSKVNSDNASLTKQYNSMAKDYGEARSEYSKVYDEFSMLKESIKGLDIHFIIHNTNNNIQYYSDTVPSVKEITEPYNVVDFFLGNPMNRADAVDDDVRMLGSYIDEKKTDGQLSDYCNSAANKRMEFLCKIMGIELPIDDKKWKGHEIN